MDKRLKIQSEISQSIVDNRFIGIIDVSARLGKTRSVIDALNTVSREIEVLILAPKLPILESWKQEIVKWNLRSNIKLTYSWSNSLKKDKKFYDLVICDEIHDYNLNVLQFIKIKQLQGSRVFGMTGTLTDDDYSIIYKILKLKKIYEYSFHQAIIDGIIADYNITCIGCELDNELKYIESGSKDKPFLQTEYQAYQYWNTRYNDAIENNDFHLIKNIINKRSNIIYNSISKLKKTQKIIQQFDRCLIFTARTNIADQIGDSAFHSKSNKNVLDKFMKEEYNKLSVISTVSMGITFPNLKTIIFNQLKSSESLCIQQSMRSMSLEDNRIADINIVYLKDTQDEFWMNNAISEFDKNKIKYI